MFQFYTFMFKVGIKFAQTLGNTVGGREATTSFHLYSVAAYFCYVRDPDW